jgi:hypothetical protein
MTISDIQRQILADAAQHEAQLASSPSGFSDPQRDPGAGLALPPPAMPRFAA